MASIKETAMAFVPKKTKNVADLDQVDVELILRDGTGTDVKGEPFAYKFIELNDEEYRVPESVIAQLKDVLEARPTMNKFKVKKAGSGMQTKYTVVGL